MSIIAQQKPHLVRLLEAVAAVMGLDEGHEELVLEFDDGHLRRWSRGDMRNGAQELGRFDDEAASLVSRLRV